MISEVSSTSVKGTDGRTNKRKPETKIRYLIGRTDGGGVHDAMDDGGGGPPRAERKQLARRQLCNRDWRVQKRATHSAHHSDGRDGSSFNSWMTARTPLSQLSAMQIRLPSGNRTAKGVGWQKQRQQLREGGRGGGEQGRHVDDSGAGDALVQAESGRAMGERGRGRESRREDGPRRVARRRDPFPSLLPPFRYLDGMKFNLHRRRRRDIIKRRISDNDETDQKRLKRLKH